jgi:hypothetical protein
MKTVKFILLFFILTCFLESCRDKKKDEGDKPPTSVFKLRGDYINNVVVCLSDDKSRITCFPAPVDPNGNPDIKPLLLDSGYYWDNCGVGLNSAYLSVTKSEWKTMINEHGFPSKDSMMKLVLDPDPFLELYSDDNRLLEGKKSFEEDTVKLNSWIRKGELGKYLKRLK